MATNNRIFFATQEVDVASVSNVDSSITSYGVVHGLQTFGATTNFNLRQAFELGQLAIYENIEGTPDVELTMQKVLDGYPLIGHLATAKAVAPDLVSRINGTKAVVQLGIYPDTNVCTTGTINSGNGGTNTQQTIMQCSGMYLSSWGFNFPLEEEANEECTFVGNDKVWLADSRIVNTTSLARSNDLTFTGKMNNADAPTGTLGLS